MNEYNSKIEKARELYSIKFLNEQFENKEDNRIRKNKLDKLSSNINEKYKIETRGKQNIKKGFYILQNPEKYMGNPQEVIYQSSWEFAFCKFCDLNDNVVKWCGESLEIPYKTTNDVGQVETHRYYPDFYLEMTKNNDLESYERMFVEIKPKAECALPVKPKKETLKTLENYEYALRTLKKNLHKWAFTKDWCEKRGIKFIIITEDHLRAKGLIP